MHFPLRCWFSSLPALEFTASILKFTISPLEFILMSYVAPPERLNDPPFLGYGCLIPESGFLVLGVWFWDRGAIFSLRTAVNFLQELLVDWNTCRGSCIPSPFSKNGREERITLSWVGVADFWSSRLVECRTLHVVTRS